MFLQERHEAILSMLHDNGKVLVKDLSARFSVTEDCIRKDLGALEKQGLLKRTYGGAVLPKPNHHLLHVSQRTLRDMPAKQMIAQKALDLITPGDVIYLDISTSCLEIARLLLSTGRIVTVVTNMVEVLTTLSGHAAITTIFVGGAVNAEGDGCTGVLTSEIISRVKCDIAFVGTVGVDASTGAVYTYQPDDGYTKRAILRASRSAYLVAENAKFNAEGNFCYARVGDFQGILTEFPPPSGVMRRLDELGIKVY